MKIVKSQDLCTSIPLSRIVRTEVQHKDDNRWIVVAIVENDRAVTLARYSSEKDAIQADTLMWISNEEIYQFPLREDLLTVEVEPVEDPDVVAVTRCRDCIDGEIDNPDFPDQYFCHYYGDHWNCGDHYCSYGRSKEQANVRI